MSLFVLLFTLQQLLNSFAASLFNHLQGDKRFPAQLGIAHFFYGEEKPAD